MAQTRTWTERRDIGCGCLIVLAPFALIALLVFGAFYEPEPEPPVTVTMPDFIGKGCKSSQSRMDDLLRDRVEGVYQDDSMSPGSDFICTSGIVTRTKPEPGTVITLTEGKAVKTTWWAIEDKVFDWYRSNPTMPDLVGEPLTPKGQQYDEFGVSFEKYMTVVVDSSAVGEPTESGWYEVARTKVTRTEPKAGATLRTGEHITVWATQERGQWVPNDRSDSSGSGAHGPHVGVCLGFGPLHACT